MARESLEESPTCVFTRGTEQLAETVRQLSFYLTNVQIDRMGADMQECGRNNDTQDEPIHGTDSEQ